MADPPPLPPAGPRATPPAQPLPPQPAAKTPDAPAAVVDTAPRDSLSTDQVMPTCMIYTMFIGVALLTGFMACWMGSALLTALQLFH